jgi:hypothetical protein
VSDRGSTSLAGESAPPLGRLLRGLLAAWFLFVVATVLPRASLVFATQVLAVAFGLAVVYLLLGFAVAAFAPGINRWLGAIVAMVPASMVFLLGGPAGQIAVLGFLGVSLGLAALRADPGCEVMSIPAFLTGRRTHLACLLFTPLDWLELRLREALRSN